MTTKRRVLRAWSARVDADEARATFALASLVLRYPDEQLIESLPSLNRVYGQLPRRVGEPFAVLCRRLEDVSLLDSQTDYVATFDLKRRCCLYLSYYLNGDTRRRGMALWRFLNEFKVAGQEVAQGELPDYLPAILEFAALGHEDAAIRLMHEHRAGLLVLLEALDELNSPYAGIVRVVDSLLPPRLDRTITEAERLVYEGPPSELVGIDDGTALAPYRGSLSVGCGSDSTPVTYVNIERRARS
ncbi:MAG: nitrate reductase molybdenum cofactor assembly chaperone [Acidimicrobiales bacterium]